MICLIVETIFHLHNLFWQLFLNFIVRFHALSGNLVYHHIAYGQIVVLRKKKQKHMKMLCVAGGMSAFGIFSWFYIHGSIFVCKMTVVTIDFVRNFGNVFIQIYMSIYICIYKFLYVAHKLKLKFFSSILQHFTRNNMIRQIDGFNHMWIMWISCNWRK